MPIKRMNSKEGKTKQRNKIKKKGEKNGKEAKKRMEEEIAMH